MQSLAGKLAGDVSYEIARARSLLDAVALAHGLGSPEEGRATRLGEIRGAVPKRSQSSAGGASGEAIDVARLQLSGDPVKDARLIELSFAAKAASRR